MNFFAVSLASALVVLLASSVVRGSGYGSYGSYGGISGGHGGYGGYGGVTRAVYVPYASPTPVHYPNYLPGMHYGGKKGGSNFFELLVFFFILMAIFGSYGTTVDEDGKKHHGFLFG